MKYSLAIFDMDGTILDTLEDLADSTNYALKLNNLPVRTIDEIRSFVGNGIGKLIERAVPAGSSQDVIDKVYNDMTAYYKLHNADKTKAYDGINECITSLRSMGIKTAVVSNKVDYAVKELCDKYFTDLFDASVGDRPGMERKPAPDSVNEVLSQLGIDRSQAVYIGDSDVDFQTAVNAKIPCISVTWGFRTKEFLEGIGANRFADEPSEILDFFRE